MLKAELIRPRLEARNGQVWTRSIPADYRYLTIASDLITLFRQYVGRSRATLAEALHDYEGDSLDYPVIRGLAAVLEARATFGNDPPVNPIELRETLFRRGPVTSKRDLFSLATREQVLTETAASYGLMVEQIETALLADLAEEQILLDTGESIAPGDLIARYNLELARGLLYWAREVRIFIHGGYKDFFKYVKLFKLMHTIHMGGQASGYHITLHGPISPFVKSTSLWFTVCQVPSRVVVMSSVVNGG